MSDTWISLGDATAKVINSIAEKRTMTRSNSDLKTRAQQIMRLTEQREEITLDIKAAFDAAASVGFNKAAMRKAIKIASMDGEKRAKHDAGQMDLEIYLAEIEGRNVREAAE